MAFAGFCVCFFLCLLLIIVQAKGTSNSTCPKSFSCGKKFANLSFPFSLSTQAKCGLMSLSGCDDKPHPRIQLLPGGDRYKALRMPYNYTLLLMDPKLETTLKQHKCQVFDKNFSIPNYSPSISFSIRQDANIFSFYKCNNTSSHTSNVTGFKMYNGCKGFSIYYNLSSEDIRASNLPPANCSLIRLPIDRKLYDPNSLNWLSPGFYVEWKLSDECYECHYSGGQCQTDKSNKFHCHRDAETNRSKLGLTLGIVFGGVGLLIMITCLAVCYKKKFRPSHFRSTDTLSNNFKYDVEGFFCVAVFTYLELEEATNDFNSSKVLGDGGFGTVYHGKLKDGREVAVKRLYEHNCKRLEQFVNEIEILTRLRHNNLVTLYGCTSRRSRELLLVYEYIPNGTLADHLHGNRAKNGSLTWPIRMNIAIETAGALAYLHSSEIIHCDVKTNNILLDHNFSVKVAGFGISRLFPNDVSHILTAPRGTPGYIDPTYHECYQLTSRSDVYSFGVVLVELISSMPAVDMKRHSQEINLANFAINKIVKCAFNELIDPSLGFDSDSKIWEMTTSVAELAFLCLQTDRDMRPTMVEVLDTLKEIQANEFEFEKRLESNLSEDEAEMVTAESHFPESQDVFLLKQVKSLPSPDSVTDKWVTCSHMTSSTS